MLCFGAGALYYVFTDAAQWELKIDAGEHIIGQRDLETVTMPASEFAANRSGDEVWINGGLYDISSYKEDNGTVRVTVFHDKDEEVLVKNVSASFEQNDQPMGATHQIGKCHAPIFNDGKILSTPFSLACVFPETVCYRTTLAVGIPDQTCSSIATPPPDASFI